MLDLVALHNVILPEDFKGKHLASLNFANKENFSCVSHHAKLVWIETKDKIIAFIRNSEKCVKAISIAKPI